MVKEIINRHKITEHMHKEDTYKEESVTESDSEKENNTGKKVKSDLSKICGSPNVKWTDIKGNEITIELLRDSLSNPRDFPTIYKVNRYLTTCMKTN